MRRDNEIDWPILRTGLEPVLAEYQKRGGILADRDRHVVEQALREKDATGLRAALSASVLLAVWLNPESRVKVARGKAVADLVVDRPGVFLVEIANDAGAKSEMRVRVLPGAEMPPLFAVEFVRGPKVGDRLDGNGMQFLLVTVRCREVGRREAAFQIDAGQGTQDLGFRSEVPVLFRIARGE